MILYVGIAAVLLIIVAFIFVIKRQKQTPMSPTDIEKAGAAIAQNQAKLDADAAKQ